MHGLCRHHKALHPTNNSIGTGQKTQMATLENVWQKDRHHEMISFSAKVVPFPLETDAHCRCRCRETYGSGSLKTTFKELLAGDVRSTTPASSCFLVPGSTSFSRQLLSFFLGFLKPPKIHNLNLNHLMAFQRAEFESQVGLGGIFTTGTLERASLSRLKCLDLEPGDWKFIFRFRGRR